MGTEYAELWTWTRRNIISGIKGYYTKLKKSKACGKSIHQSAKSSEAARRKKKLVGKNSWFRQDNKTKEQEVSTENNENRGGSASGNPMLATPSPRSKCGGEDGSKRSNCGGEYPCIKKARVDAEKQVNRGGSASGNPMLATPNPEPNSSKQTNPQSRISTVLFVEQTRRGGLAAKMRETISRLEPMLGFRWKVVENAGTNLASLLVKKNPWAGGICGRRD